MTYAIEGRHCELLRVELAAGERVIAEVGTLVYLRWAVEWHVVFPGRWVRRRVSPSHNSLYALPPPTRPQLACWTVVY